MLIGQCKGKACVEHWEEPKRDTLVDELKPDDHAQIWEHILSLELRVNELESPGFSEPTAENTADWADEVAAESERLGLKHLLYKTHACVRAQHGRLLSLHCTAERRFSWRTVHHFGQFEPTHVGGDIECIGRLTKTLKQKGWTEE